MRILIYKRTHIGDPDEKGRFGIYDCMGSVRDHRYDAVIGVGGIGREPMSFGIDRKVNWVGIGPTKHSVRNGRGALVTFAYLRRWESLGPMLGSFAPLLAKRLYNNGARLLLTNYTSREQAEAESILTWARRQSPPSLPTPGQLRVPPSCQYRCRRC